MKLRDADILTLPDAPDFISKPPVYPLHEFIALCEKLLPYWNKQRLAKPPPLPTGEPFSLVDEVGGNYSPGGVKL
jgi:hypothetical protein